MRKLFLLLFSIGSLGYLYAQEPSDIRGHFKVTKGDFIQLGYDVPKTLTLGTNTTGINKGRFGFETYTYDSVTTGFKIYQTTSTTNTPFIFIKDDGVIGIGTYYSTIGINDKEVKMANYKLYVNGAMRASSYFYTSDEKLKTNLRSITHNSLNNIKVYEYSFRTDIKDMTLDTETHFGVKAQELKELYPNLVYDAADYMSVNYYELIPILIETMQNQNQKIKELEHIISQY